MGMRSLQIPANPQPQNLGDPIPSSVDPTLQQILGDPRLKQASPAAMQSMQSAPQPSEPSPTLGQVLGPPPEAMQREPAGKNNAGKTNDEELLKTFNAINKSVPKAAKKAAHAADKVDLLKAFQEEIANQPNMGPDDNVADDGSEMGPITPAVVSNDMRRFVSIARNDVERANAFKKLGAEVKYQDGQLMVQMPGSDGFHPYTEPHLFDNVVGKDFESYKNLWTNLKGMMASNATGLAQGAVSAAIQIGGKAAAGAIAADTFGLASGPAALLSSAAGIAAASVGGPKAREAAVKAAGIHDDTYDIVDDIKRDMVGNTLGEVGGAAIGKGAQWISNRWAPIATELKYSPEYRANVALKMRLALRDMIDESPHLQVPAKQAGEIVRSGIEASGSRLQQAVEGVDDLAIQRGKGKTFPMTNTLARMREALDRARIPVDDVTGQVRIPETVKKIFSDRERQIQDLTSASARPLTDSELAAATDEINSTAQSRLTNSGKSLAPFGDAAGGPKLLMEIAEDYPRLLALQNSEGGVPVDQVLDVTRRYQGLAKFEDFKNNGEANAWLERISGAGTTDRDAAMKAILDPNSPEFKNYKMAYQGFHDDIDRVASLRAAVRGTTSPEQIADAIFRKDSSEIIKNMKWALGPSSDEWNKLRGSWIASKINDSIRSDGIFDGKKFLTSLSDLGKEGLAELGDTAELGRLKKLAPIMQRIDFDDLASNPKSREAFTQVTGTMLKAKMSAASYVRNIFKLTGGRVSAIDFTKDEVLSQFMKGAGSDAERELISDVAEQLDTITQASRRVPMKGMVKRGGKLVMSPQMVYVPNGKMLNAIVNGTAVGAANLHNATTDQSPGSPAQQQLETPPEDLQQ